MRLLHRSTRSQTLTAEGQAYYERCTRALAELDAAEAALDRGRVEPTGRLRVSLPEAFGQLVAAPILLGVVRQHPRMQLDSFSDRFVDLIEEGIDLAVRIGPLAGSSALVARHLGTQHMRVGASPAYLAWHGTPTDPDALEGHTVVACSRSGVPVPTPAAAGVSEAQVRIPSQVSMDAVQAIAAAAVEGFGLAWLPCWLLSRHVRSGRLVCVLEHLPGRPREIHAVWPQVRPLRCRTRAAIDALVTGVPGMIGP